MELSQHTCEKTATVKADESRQFCLQLTIVRKRNSPSVVGAKKCVIRDLKNIHLVSSGRNLKSFHVPMKAGRVRPDDRDQVVKLRIAFKLGGVERII